MALLTKALEWGYEMEWRILDVEKGAGVGVFAPEDLKGIILGHRISKNHAEKICEVASKYFPHLPIYQAAPHPTQFRMVIETHR